MQFIHFYSINGVYYLPEMEVLYIDIFVRGCLALAPQKKSLLSGQLYNKAKYGHSNISTQKFIYILLLY